MDAPMILRVKSLDRVEKHMIWWISSIPGNLTTAEPLIKWYGTFQYETPLGRLGPPIIAKTRKKKIHNHCAYVIAWYISVAVRKTDAYSYNTFNVLDGRFCHDQILKAGDEIDQ